MIHGRPLSQVEIEDMIVALSDELEKQTEAFRDVAEDAARSEMDYKRDAARAMLAVIDQRPKATVSERQARVDLITHDTRTVAAIHEARRHAARESLLSLRTRMEALRTLSASVRFQT